MFPIDERSMQIRYTFLSCATHATEDHKSSMMNWSQEVTEEDIKICEAVQKNLESGKYNKGKLSPVHEKSIAYFQEQWRKDMQWKD